MTEARTTFIGDSVVIGEQSVGAYRCMRVESIVSLCPLTPIWRKPHCSEMWAPRCLATSWSPVFRHVGQLAKRIALSRRSPSGGSRLLADPAGLLGRPAHSIGCRATFGCRCPLPSHSA